MKEKIELHYRADNKEAVRRIQEVLNQFGEQLVTISIEKLKRDRSNQQNRYYWGVVVPLVRLGFLDTGYRLTKEQTHNELKKMFLIVEIVNEQTGEIKQITGDSKGLSTVEFMDYIAQIQQFGAEFLGIVIPDPVNEENEKV